MDTYIKELEGLIDGFRYEKCGECGRELHAHVISSDMFGKPHAWCLDEDKAGPEADLDRDDDENVYHAAVMELVKAFTAGPCCDAPLAAHTFSPGWPSGLPHLWCPDNRPTEEENIPDE